MTLTIYRWLLCLYPLSYRHDFAEEMASVFREARSALAPALAAKIKFYRRESLASYPVPCALIWTVCSALAFRYRGSICNPHFVFRAPPCF